MTPNVNVSGMFWRLVKKIPSVAMLAIWVWYGWFFHVDREHGMTSRQRPNTEAKISHIEAAHATLNRTYSRLF